MNKAFVCVPLLLLAACGAKTPAGPTAEEVAAQAAADSELQTIRAELDKAKTLEEFADIYGKTKRGTLAYAEVEKRMGERALEELPKAKTAAELKNLLGYAKPSTDARAIIANKLLEAQQAEAAQN